MNPSERGPVLRRTDKGFLPAVDDFAEESHIALTSDAGHQVSVLGTPADLEAFALGHALAEGWWDGRGEAPTITTGTDASGQTAHVHGNVAWGPVKESRFILPSCGGCGELLSSPPPGKSLSGGVPMDSITVAKTLRSIREHQALFDATGGVHAAALAHPDGVMLVAEDIGRHTAVDKVAGFWFDEHRNKPPSTLLLSGRCGWDLMAKVVRLGIPQVACVGAMSNQAARLAREHGVLVMGFASGDDPQFVGPWPGFSAKA
ncbi:MAG TPA: hypothetical protein HA286_04415 [Candidatus Poseidoniaceae archaeon]|nr:MAG TPA: hypothetical protein D7H96_04350 [Candidatus Poseidoniales archaeon]HIH53504.1 hypothetical protein [Candidatus Poseidoniaceae archaeon]